MKVVLVYGSASVDDALHLDFALQEISRHGVRLRLSPNVFAVAAALAVSPTPMSAKVMAEYLYGEQEDGGPERALSTVRVTVMNARRALKIFRGGGDNGTVWMAWIPRRRWFRLHQVYLESEGWLRLRRSVMKRCAGLCEACRHAPAVEVHHLSYAHWRSERLSELQGLCRKCHRRAHKGKTGRGAKLD